MECEFCGKIFSSKTNLLRHQRTVADCVKLQGKTLQENICEYCKGLYTEKSSLNRHLLNCKVKRNNEIEQNITVIKTRYRRKISNIRESHKSIVSKLNKENEKLRKVIEEKDGEITALKVKCESNLANGKVEVYHEVCTKVLDKSTVTNNNAYIHPKLVNLPITNIHPLTEDYIKSSIDNGGYTFDHYIKGANGLVDFIYSITMCENDSGDLERNYVCTDPSRDSYHRLVETKEWQKDKGGKFVDVILDTLSDKADGYHMKLFDERSSKTSKLKTGYDPDYIYKLNTDMHSGIVQTN